MRPSLQCQRRTASVGRTGRCVEGHGSLRSSGSRYRRTCWREVGDRCVDATVLGPQASPRKESSIEAHVPLSSRIAVHRGGSLTLLRCTITTMLSALVNVGSGTTTSPCRIWPDGLTARDRLRCVAAIGRSRFSQARVELQLRRISIRLGRNLVWTILLKSPCPRSNDHSRDIWQS